MRFFKKSKEQYSIPIMQDDDSLFVQARKAKAMFNDKQPKMIMVYGTKANELINEYSVHLIDSKTNSSYTLFYSKDKFVAEAMVLKLSPLRYLIIYYKDCKLFKILSKAKKRHSLVTVDDASNKYSLISFHGDEAKKYFDKNKVNLLYYVKWQNYSHYWLIVEQKHLSETIEIFLDKGFLEIHLETKEIFMYNNNVIDLTDIPRKYQNSIFRTLCSYNNHIYKGKDKFLMLQQYEVQEDINVLPKTKVYNHLRKKIGFVYLSYRISNKRNPYIIAIVSKFKVGKFALLKIAKREIIAKQIINY